MDAIERTNWLAHRWPIEMRVRNYGGWKIHAGEIEGHRVGQSASRQEYDRWLQNHRPICLARLITGHPTVHPAVVLVVADNYRLGRIPPEFWCGYDVVHLIDLPRLTLLSAKVRAMFPAWPSALIRVVRNDEVSALALSAAPEGQKMSLKTVA